MKEPDRDNWETEGCVHWSVCVLHLKRSENQSLPERPKLVPDKKDPDLCDFMEPHYVDKQVKSIKESGEPRNYPAQDGGSLYLT